MQSLSEVSLQEFQKELTPLAIRTFRIIYSALAAGVLFFLLIIFIMYTKHISLEANIDDLSYFNTLSLVNAVLIIVTFISSSFFYNRQFSKKNLQNSVTKDILDPKGNQLNLTPAQKCLSLIRTAAIIRIAPLEGSAFFGMVFTLLAVQNGVADLSPVYLLNALSVIPMLITVAATFPSTERLEKIFEEKIQGANNG